MSFFTRFLFFLTAICAFILPMGQAHAGFLAPIIGLIATVAFASTGIGLVVSLVASIGLSLLTQALFKPAQRQATTQMPQHQGQVTIDQKQTIRQATAPRKVVYGETRVGGIYAFLNTVDNNQFLYFVICYAGHEVEAIGDIWFDEEVVPLNENGDCVTGRFAGNVHIEKFLGRADQEAASYLFAANPQWTVNHRLAGIAYIAGRLRWDNTSGDGTVGQKVWSGGLPNITAVIKGKKVYDPRTRTIGYSNNSALCVSDYLCDQVYGMAVDYATTINEEALIAAANACDETIPLSGGGAEKRYTTDGVFASDAKPDDILGQLLGSMQGKAIYDGDQWTVYAGVYQFPALVLTDDDMRKASSITTLTSAKSAFNSVKGTFVGPDNKWQAADFPPVVSETYKQLDGNYPLFRDIQLPFTISPGRAQRIAKVELLKGRQDIVENYYGKLSVWRVRTGSTILRNSERYGWVNKPFEVNGVSFTIDEDDDGNPILGVDITLSETDPSIYDWSFNEELAMDPSPNTNFPDFFSASPPTPPFTVSEQLYISDNGFRSSAHFEWGPSTDQFVEKGGSYALRYRLLGDIEWTAVPLTRVAYYNLLDIPPGRYEAEVRSVNWADQMSQEFLFTSFEIFGVLLKPSAPTGLNVIPLSGGTVAHATWDKSPDVDVLKGGFIEFHHSPQFSDVEWSTTTRISTGVLPGNSTETLLPLKAGTYAAKFVDAGGTYSDMAIFVQFQSSVLDFITAGAVIEDPGFSGAKTNVVVSGDFMRLTSGSTSGLYEFANVLDLAIPQKVRITSHIDAIIENTLDTVDSRLDVIDNWSSFDGDVAGGEADFYLEMRSTNDNPAGASPVWTSWQRFHTVEAEGRAFQFRGHLFTIDPGFTPAIHELSVIAEVISGTALPAIGTGSAGGSSSAAAVGVTGGGGPTLSAVGQASSSTSSVDISSTGRGAGDLCIFINYNGNAGAAPTSSVPTGFTLIDTHSGTGFGYGITNTISYKVLTGSETTITGFSGTDQTESVALIFRKSGGTWGTPAGVNINLDPASGSTAQTINSGAGAAPLIVIGEVGRFIFSYVNHYSSSPTSDGTYYPGWSSSYGWKIYNSSPANVTFTPTGPAGDDSLTGGFYITAS